MKCSFKARVKNPMSESSPVFVLKLGFLIHLFVWKLFPSPYTFLARQSHFHDLSEKSFEQRKEMTFDCGLANIRAAVFIAPPLKI